MRHLSRYEQEIVILLDKFKEEYAVNVMVFIRDNISEDQQRFAALIAEDVGLACSLVHNMIVTSEEHGIKKKYTHQEFFGDYDGSK